MQADHVHTHAGKACSELFRILMGGGVGAGRYIKAQEPGSFPVFKVKMTVSRCHKAVAACGRIQQMRKVQCTG